MSRLKITPEIKVMAVFTVIVWGVSIVTRYVLFEGWDGSSVVLAGFAATVLLWIIATLLKRVPLLLILVLGPLIAVFVEIFHWELISLSFNGQFSWQLDHFDARRYAIGVYMWSLFYLVLLLGYFAIFNYFRFTREAAISSKAKLHAHDAQLKMLRYQINPHFLFNTLNSVSALLLDNKNQRAEQMIDNLSNFLRFSLDNTPNAKIPLQTEIEIIKEYLEIEEIRFSEKLSTEFDIDPDTLNLLVPSLILQPAIENAIKYAVAAMKENGIIRITSSLSQRRLTVSVADNGPGMSVEKTSKDKASSGIGLTNMRERLAVIYGTNAYMNVSSELGQGVEVSVTIPAEATKRKV